MEVMWKDRRFRKYGIQKYLKEMFTMEKLQSK